MDRPDMTPDQHARMAQHFEAMNERREGIAIAVYVIGFAIAVLLCALVYLGFSLVNGTMAQAALCAPECAAWAEAGLL